MRNTLTVLPGRKPVDLPNFLPKLLLKSPEPEYTPGLYDASQILADLERSLPLLETSDPEERARLHCLITVVQALVQEAV